MDQTIEIPLERIRRSPTNPRRTYSEGSLRELADSIREHGVIQAALVRPVDDGYELVCGERRHRAAELAELVTIPCRVRALSDAQVLEIQIIENAQREDVHPLEEADALIALHEEHGYPVEDLAAKLGRPPAFVYRRLALVRLSEPVRAALQEERIGVGVAEVLSKVAPDVQGSVLEEITRWQNRPPTIGDAVAAVRARYRGLRLVQAPWSLDDDELVPSAGACAACPKRTSSQLALLEDDDEDDRCTDAGCWNTKSAAAWERVSAAAVERGVEVLDAAASKKLFAYGSSLAYGSDFVDLDGECWEARPESTVDEEDENGEYVEPPPCPTWREVLAERQVSEVLARTPSGEPRTLARAADVAAAIAAAPREGDPESKRITRSTGSDQKASLEKDRRARAIREDGDRRATAALVECVENGDLDEPIGFWRALASGVVRTVWADRLSAAADRRELRGAGKGRLDATEALDRWIEDAAPAAALGLIVELVATSVNAASAREQLLEEMGIDAEAYLREAKAEAKAREKAKKTKASKKAPAKPKRARRTKGGEAEV